MRSPTRTNGSRRTAGPRISAAVLAFFLMGSLLVAGVPVGAAETGSELAGDFTFDPPTGPSNASRVFLDDVVCPTVEGTNEPTKKLAIAEVGKESPTIESRMAIGFDIPTSGPYLFLLAYDLAKEPAPEAGYIANFDLDWLNPAGDSITPAQVSERLADGGNYNLVLACTYQVFDTEPDDYNTYLYPDETGHVAANWNRITTSADGLRWTIGGSAVAPTETSTALEATVSPNGIQLTATVSTGGATATTATGQVGFRVNGSFVANVPLTEGIASYAYEAPTVPGESYEFTAVYDPLADAAFAGSSSPAVAVAIPGEDPAVGTSLVLIAVPTATGGVSLTATVQQDGAVATDGAGTVVFRRGTEAVGTPQEVVDGIASVVDLALAPGEYRYTATFAPAEGSALDRVDAGEVTVTVAAAGSPGGGTSGGAGGANSGFSALTDWVTQTSATPAGVAGMFGAVLLLAAAGTTGWTVFWRRRGTAS